MIDEFIRQGDEYHVASHPILSYILSFQSLKPVTMAPLVASVFLLLFLPRSVSAQGSGDRQLDFDQYTVNDGLSQNFVTCMYQDHQGFLWIGTRDGLNRFDGHSFKIYSFDVRDTTSISGNAIYSIFEDRNNTLWVGTSFGGLNKYDRSTDRFIRYRYEPGRAHPFPFDMTFPLQDDQAGMLWLGTANGLKRFDPPSGSFTSYVFEAPDPERPQLNYVYDMLEARDGNLWLGTLYPYSGLLYFNRTSERFLHFSIAPEMLAQWPLTIKAIHRDKEGYLWISDAAGLFRIDEQKLLDGVSNPSAAEQPGLHDAMVKVADSRSEIIWSLGQDDYGNIWVGSPSGLSIYDVGHLSSGSTRTSGRAAFTHLLPNLGVTCIYKDRSGLMWLGTNGHGVYKVYSPKKRFARLSINTVKADNPGRRSVRAIYQDADGMLWIGGYNGLDRLDRTTGKATNYYGKGGFGSEIVWVMYEDPLYAGEVLWIGTETGGLYRLERKAGRFLRYRSIPGSPHTLNDNFVLSVYRDSSGTLWVGTNSGLNRFDDRTGRFKQYNQDPPNPHGLRGTFLLSMCESRYANRRGLWLATNNGLFFFDPALEQFTRFVNDPRNPESISHNDILSLKKDSRGRIWIGTSGGLNQLIPRDPAGQKKARPGHGSSEAVAFVRYSENEGLPNNVINGILEDDTGHLWLSTNKGLSHFNLQSGSFKNYDVMDGLQSNEFNRGAYYRSRTGEMYFGGINGVNVFSPNDFRDNPNIPPVVITEFKVFNAPVEPARGDHGSPLEKMISVADVVRLSHEQNVFSFVFAALEYTLPGKNHYAYMMEGFDRDWQYVGLKREAVYTNLAPGKYTFRVKAANNDGIWNEQGASVEVIIAPPLWRTWWAYLLYALLTVWLLLVLRRYELHRMRLKDEVTVKHLEVEKLKELDAMKSRFFSNISHEFRTPLTLILGPVENMLAHSTDERLQYNLKFLQRNATNLLRLVNQLLNLTRLESGKIRLDASRGDIVQCVRNSVAAFESLARSRNLTLHFSSSAKTLEAMFNREHLETILYNLLSNAMKFTPDGGEITVRLSELKNGLTANRTIREKTPHAADRYAVISVSDTGIGIPANKLPHVFERFYQAESAGATRKYEGTGIGLTLVKELVELHQGNVAINSKEGKGTEIVVRFPVLADIVSRTADNETVTSILPSIEPSTKVELPQPTIDSMPVGRDETIVLVVEDNADMQSYMRGCLEPDYQVVTANDGEAGLQMAREWIPNLVITDVMMPKMDGLQLCTMLKADENTSHLPVILLTARAGEEDRLEGLETGADAFLTKPFNARELLVLTANLIRMRRKLREKFSTESFLQSGKLKQAESRIDEAFLKRATAVVESHMSDESFSVEILAEAMHMSRTQLHRKLTALTNQPTARFIRSIRLHHAKTLLRQNDSLINEVAFLVGFNSHAYFSKCFYEEFGSSPTEFIKANRST